MITPIQNTDILLQAKPVAKIQAEINENMQSPAGGLKNQDNDAALHQANSSAKNRKKEEKNAAVEFDVLAEKIKSFLELDDVTVEFSKDDETNKMVLKLVDSATREVLRQIPEESVLQIARFIAKKLDQGQLTDEKI